MSRAVGERAAKPLMNELACWCAPSRMPALSARSRSIRPSAGSSASTNSWRLTWARRPCEQSACPWAFLALGRPRLPGSESQSTSKFHRARRRFSDGAPQGRRSARSRPAPRLSMLALARRQSRSTSHALEQVLEPRRGPREALALPAPPSSQSEAGSSARSRSGDACASPNSSDQPMFNSASPMLTMGRGRAADEDAAARGAHLDGAVLVGIGDASHHLVGVDGVADRLLVVRIRRPRASAPSSRR